MLQGTPISLKIQKWSGQNLTSLTAYYGLVLYDLHATLAAS